MRPALRNRAARGALCAVVLWAARLWALPAPTRYPFDLRVGIAARAEAARYDLEFWGAISAPPGEPSTTFVGKQALDAYRAIAARLFQAGAPVALRLEIQSVRGRVDLESDGWHAIVEHDLVARNESGGVLGRWSVEGRGRVQGLGQGAIPAAFARAADLAAQRFESQFETPAELVSWMQRSGVSPGAIARRPASEEPPLPPPPPPSGPPRAPLIVYADAGVGLSPISTRTQSGPSSSVAPGLDARLGLSGRWAFAQLGFSWWNSRDSELEHGSTSIGLDAGPLFRFDHVLEVGLGAGLHATMTKVSVYNYGPQPVWVRSLQIVPSAVAAIRLVPPIRSFRMRVTFEARLPFAPSDSTVVQGGSANGFSDHLEAEQTFAILIGGELPLVRSSR